MRGDTLRGVRSAPRFIKKSDSTVLLGVFPTPFATVLLRNCSEMGHKAVPERYGFAAFFDALFSERM